MGEANSGKISLKLLVDRNAKRVVFGEAGKDFVDFLFEFLSLPVGTVVKLLSKDKMVGSLGKIYESIEEMPARYMQPDVNKELVLKASDSTSKVFDQCDGDGDGDTDTEYDGDHDTYGYDDTYECEYDDTYECEYDDTYGDDDTYECEYDDTYECEYDDTYDTYKKKFFYGCGYGCACMSNNRKVKCTGCGRLSLTVKMTYIESPENETGKVGGYVKELVNYMIMDNLVVKPMSTISSFTLLSNVKDMRAVETLEVFIGKNEAVDLLKASFVTDKVLSSVFVGNQKI